MNNALLPNKIIEKQIFNNHKNSREYEDINEAMKKLADENVDFSDEKGVVVVSKRHIKKLVNDDIQQYNEANLEETMEEEDLEVQKRIEKAKKCESVLDNIYNGLINEISESLFPKRAIPNST
jgi:hypothetical protein